MESGLNMVIRRGEVALALKELKINLYGRNKIDHIPNMLIDYELIIFKEYHVSVDSKMKEIQREQTAKREAKQLKERFYNLGNMDVTIKQDCKKVFVSPLRHLTPKLQHGCEYICSLLHGSKSSECIYIGFLYAKITCSFSPLLNSRTLVYCFEIYERKLKSMLI
ncbi:uncharacterized protein LOC131593286 [Vicia villosa]|uniref:uncharacterized protein LOC131593286 n=1 Tax=Vicia villosa TaxID=3911 RepID=UPI00273AA0A6|nr:uncharacterized protein LOC131593286 [Vicia villosa]